MRRFARRLIPAVLLVMLYLVWQPLPIRPELVVEARWAIDPAVEPVVPDPATDAIPVIGTDRFVYLNDEGAVTYRGIVAHRVAMSDDAFVNYPRSASQIVVQDRSGGFLASLPVAGHPFFIGDRLFVVSDGGGSLSEWSRDATLEWRVELPAPLTVIDASHSLAAVGLAAGGALLLGGDGSRIELQRPTADGEPIVSAVAVSEAVPRLAVVAGQGSREATLTLYDLATGRGIPVVRRRITRHTEVPPLVELTDGGRLLVYADDDPRRLVQLDPERGEEWMVELTHPPRALFELPGGVDVVLGVSTRPDPARGFATPAELSLVTPSGAVPLRASWAARASDLAVRDGLVLLEVDERVIAFTVEVEE